MKPICYGQKHFYKVESDLRYMPPRLLKKVDQRLKGVQVDMSDGAAVGEAVGNALVSLQSGVIAAHVYGARVITRKQMMRDFDRMEDGDGITILDKKIADDYHPRPTQRGFGGLVPGYVVKMHEEEKRLYWDRLEKGEPIPPEVWKFLEDARSGRYFEEHKCKREAIE